MREREEVRKHIGIVFQDPSSDEILTGRENLEFHLRMCSIPKEERERRIEEVLDLLDLRGRENIKLRDCPAGIRRRFEVARGFLLHPDVLFLDEPTIGFDVKARRDLWNYIRRVRDTGTTVILTTHYIEEADELCDRVAIIDRGKIAAADSPQKLKEAVGVEILSVELAEPGDFERFARSFDWVEEVGGRGNKFLLKIRGGNERIAELLEKASASGFEISSFESRPPTLEDVFLHLTGRTIREAEGEFGAEQARRIRARLRAGRRF